MDPYLLAGILVSFLFYLFLITLEIAYRNSNALQMQLEGRLGTVPGKILSIFSTRPAWFIGTTFLGAFLSLAAIVMMAMKLLFPWLVGVLPGQDSAILAIFINALLLTIPLVGITIYVPAWIVSGSANRFLYYTAIPFAVVFILLCPLTIPLVTIVRYVMRNVVKLNLDDGEVVFGFPDIRHFLTEPNNFKSAAGDNSVNRKILENALEFKTVKIRECMIPRTEITAVELHEPIDRLRALFVESGHSKVIIYKKTIDEVVGYCHSSSLFKKPGLIQDILTPIIIVPETMLANELMLRFISERKSLAVVVDEFGGTSGIVSMEDVIEEIFGEIEDEYDEEDQLLVEQKLYDNAYLISARLEIDYLNETYGWELPTGEYETLGGLILAYAEDFPKQGQVIQVPPFTFIIQTTGQNRIKTVLVEIESDRKTGEKAPE